MCGRYTLSAPSDVIAELFDVEPVPMSPRYNVAPTQEAPVVRVEDPEAGRELALLRWGLVPFWAKDPSIGNRMINARSETASEKNAFRNSFKKRRCLVVADGFYEWKKEQGGKQPYWIHLSEAKPFAMAGLWSRWDKDGEAPLETFTILTTDAHPKIAGVHDRMPVVLRKDAYEAWLDPELQDKDELNALLTAESGEWLEFYPVSREVNSPSNDRPDLIESLE